MWVQKAMALLKAPAFFIAVRCLFRCFLSTLGVVYESPYAGPDPANKSVAFALFSNARDFNYFILTLYLFCQKK